MIILIITILCVTLIPNLAIQEPNAFLQEKISNQFNYNPSAYESCPFQTDCSFNSALTSSTFSDYLEYTLPESV